MRLLLLLAFLTSTAYGQVLLTSKNAVTLRGEINYKSMDDAVKEVLKLDSERKSNTPIYLVVESPGGSISAGEAGIEALKTVQNLHTITIFAASMASAIVEALPGKRLILESGTLMFHRAAGSFEGQFETGEVESRLAAAKDVVLRLESRNANRLGMKLSDYKAAVKDELWVSGDKTLGKYADKIVSIKCSKDLIEAVSVREISIMGLFTLRIETSKCPLLKTGKMADKDSEEKSQKYRDIIDVYNRKQGVRHGI